MSASFCLGVECTLWTLWQSHELEHKAGDSDDAGFTFKPPSYLRYYFLCFPNRISSRIIFLQCKINSVVKMWRNIIRINLHRQMAVCINWDALIHCLQHSFNIEIKWWKNELLELIPSLLSSCIICCCHYQRQTFKTFHILLAKLNTLSILMGSDARLSRSRSLGFWTLYIA
jgi:hypothetical protein